MRAKYLVILNMIVLNMVIFKIVKAQTTVNSNESARIFVQNFYDWYNKLYEADVPGKKHAVSAEDAALNTRAIYFDDRLRKAIIADNKAQAKVKGEIVGLESDPFLMAQDIGFDYQTGNVKKIGSKFMVDIHSDFNGKTRKQILKSEVVVIAEVTNVNGQWKFTNFIYPSPKGNSNLLDMLSNMHKDRVKWGYEKS